MHPDHIAGLMEDGAPAFPNARYVTNAAEYDFWSKDERLSGGTEQVATLVQSNVVPMAEKMSFINPGDDVVTALRRSTRRATRPAIPCSISRAKADVLCCSPILTNHYVASLQRPDWHVRFDMDKEKATAARKRVLDMIAADRVPSAGYHMPFPSVGYIEKRDLGYRWVPVQYRLSL